MTGEPIEAILKRFEGQDVFVAIEVESLDPRTCEPLTGRLIGSSSSEEEANRMIQGLKCAMVRWMGKLAEAIILYAHLPVRFD